MFSSWRCGLLLLFTIVSQNNAVARAKMMLMGGQSINDFLLSLVDLGDLSAKQYRQLSFLLGKETRTPVRDHDRKGLLDFDSVRESLQFYIASEVEGGNMGLETEMYLSNLLELHVVEDARYLSPAQADYDTSTLGIVGFQGHWRGFMDSFTGESTDEHRIYNGIWGYATGRREYALLGKWNGLDIIDITDPSNIFRVQYFRMEGGNVWRDVATHTDIETGKTYAYVGAQYGPGDANLHVIDLSHLSGNKPHTPLLPMFELVMGPIPRRGFKMIDGYVDDAHTLNIEGGLLFINSAYPGLGVRILDLSSDPWNPELIGQWRHGDGHDSIFRQNFEVDGLGRRDVLISCDGHAGRYRFLDITNLRQRFHESGTVVQLTRDTDLIGETESIAGSYAHSGAITDDGQILYVFDERNTFDVGVYDLSSSIDNPLLLSTFQWSGEEEYNAIVHNGFVRGDYLYVAYYEVGLRVFDITDRASPIEVGAFETWRDPQGSGILSREVQGDFNGAWNVYTGLPSGKVLVSDTESGLFVFDVNQT